MTTISEVYQVINGNAVRVPSAGAAPEPGIAARVAELEKSAAALNKIVENLQNLADRQEVLRKLSIGAPQFHRSTVLPDDHVWPDGSLVLFSDWPELAEAYEQGGFDGMLMPWDADNEYQAAHLGQYRPDSANPTGLYLPLHGGQFFRNWTLGQAPEAGAWGRDEIRNVVGRVTNTDADPLTSSSKISNYGALSYSNIKQYTFGANVTSSDGAFSVLDFDASKNVPTGPQNVPQHIWLPVIIYLGRPR